MKLFKPGDTVKHIPDGQLMVVLENNCHEWGDYRYCYKCQWQKPNGEYTWQKFIEEELRLIEDFIPTGRDSDT